MQAKQGLFNQTRLLGLLAFLLAAALVCVVVHNRRLAEQVDQLEDPRASQVTFSGGGVVNVRLMRRANFLSPLPTPKSWQTQDGGTLSLPEGLFEVSFGEEVWPLLTTNGIELSWDLSPTPEGFGRVPGGPGISGLDRLLTEPLDPQGKPHDGRGFLLSLTEVSVGEYDAFLDALATSKKDEDGFFSCCSDAERMLFKDGCSGHRPSRGGQDLWASQNLPEYQRRAAREVNLFDAMAYCRFLQGSFKGEARFRLPTRSEWERAARGVDGRPFPWGSDPLLPVKQAVAGLGTTVDSHPGMRSPYGHRHMGSGVSEWTISPEGQRRYRVMGRSFDLPADRIHVGYSVGESPIVRSASTGFRLVREPSR